MIQAPWTDTGSLQQDVSTLQSEMHRKAERHEVSSLNSNVGSLEREIGEVRATCDGLRVELSELQQNYRTVLDLLGQMTTVL